MPVKDCAEINTYRLSWLRESARARVSPKLFRNGGSMAKRRTTLAEVAEAAGVSVATVSKALNERSDVSAETRQRVQKHLRDASYRPTGSDAGRRRQIEVVFPRAHNAYSIAILDGITSAARSEGFEVVLGR